MRQQTIEFDDYLASIHNIITTNTETGQQISKNSWNIPELSGRDWSTVQRAGGLSVYPFVNACPTESMLAFRCLQHIAHLPVFKPNQTFYKTTVLLNEEQGTRVSVPEEDCLSTSFVKLERNNVYE